VRVVSARRCARGTAGTRSGFGRSSSKLSSVLQWVHAGVVLRDTNRSSVPSCGCAAQSCGLGARSLMAGAPTIRLRLCCWRGLGSEVLTYFPLVQTPEQRWLPCLGWDLGDGERWRQWRPVIRCGRLVQLEPVGFVCIKRRDDNGLWFRSFKEQTLVSMFPRKACLVPLHGLPRQPISSCLAGQSQASFAVTVRVSFRCRQSSIWEAQAELDPERGASSIC